MITLKASTLAAEFEHVYSADPALDMSTDEKRAAYKRALETNDPALLPIVNGQKPTRFRLRHPTGLLRRQIQDLIADGNGQFSALRSIVGMCIIGVAPVSPDTDLSIAHLADGRDMPTMATLDIFDAVDGGALVNELGTRVLEVMIASKNS
jgi:hypothetical protein